MNWNQWWLVSFVGGSILPKLCGRSKVSRNRVVTWSSSRRTWAFPGIEKLKESQQGTFWPDGWWEHAVWLKKWLAPKRPCLPCQWSQSLLVLKQADFSLAGQTCWHQTKLVKVEHWQCLAHLHFRPENQRPPFVLEWLRLINEDSCWAWCSSFFHFPTKQQHRNKNRDRNRDRKTTEATRVMQQMLHSEPALQLWLHPMTSSSQCS